MRAAELKAWGFRTIAAHRESRLFRHTAHLCRRYLSAYENVNHNLASNGEAQLIRRIRPSLHLAIDVGMHTGAWTDVVRAAHPGVVVHGFEASPDLAAELARRYSGDEGVVVNGYALGAEPARGTLYLDASHSALNSLVATCHAGVRRTVEIDIVRGDDYLEQNSIDHVDYLKVDVEGYDFDVLQGFRRALAAGAIDVVQFEYNTWTLLARHFLTDFYDLLEPLGYAIGKIHPGGVDFAPYRLEAENWRGPACLAVLRSRRETLSAVAAGRGRPGAHPSADRCA